MGFESGVEKFAILDFLDSKDQTLEPFSPSVIPEANTASARDFHIHWDESLSKWDGDILWDDDIVDGDALNADIVSSNYTILNPSCDSMRSHLEPLARF